MEKEKQIYILDELKKLFYTSSVNPSILTDHFRVNNILTNGEVEMIKHGTTSTQQIIQFCDFLKPRDSSCLLEIQKLAIMYNWTEILNYMVCELKKSGLHNLVYQKPAAGNVQGASGSTMTSVAMITKELSVKEIRDLLNKIFLHCDLNPAHYVDSLILSRVMTEFNKEDIKKETYRPGKQLKLAEGIASKGMTGVGKFRGIAVDQEDTILIEQLDKNFLLILNYYAFV